MSSINLHTREIHIKIVYYGPGLSGKTSTLQYLHRALKPELRGQLVSLATGIDRTLYFDFLPVKLPRVRDFTVRLSLYTVPGQVHYNATRKLVLQGADGVIMVADSHPDRREANLESLHNLAENLRAHGMDPDTVPQVLQYNKRDLPKVLPLADLDRDLNPRGLARFETSALKGLGVHEALKAITRLVLTDLKRKGLYRDKAEKGAAEQPRAVVVPARVEEGIVAALEGHAEPAAEPRAVARAPSLSELWPAGAARNAAQALEADIARGEFAQAIARAEGLLRSSLGAGPDTTSGCEALLLLGVHGSHYQRFKRVTASGAPSREDALFCLFFVCDLALRMQAAGVQE